MQYETIFDVAHAGLRQRGTLEAGLAIAALMLGLRVARLPAPDEGWTGIVLHILHTLRRGAAWIGGGGLLLASLGLFQVTREYGEIGRLRSGTPVTVVEGTMEDVWRGTRNRGRQWSEAITVAGRRFAWTADDFGSPFPLTTGVRAPAKGKQVRLTVFDGRIVRVETPLCRERAPCTVRYLGNVRIETSP